MIPESMLAGHKITVNANRNAKVKQNDHDRREVMKLSFAIED